MKNLFFIFFFVALAFPYLGFSQDSVDDSTFDLSYEVNRVYPSLSISKTALKESIDLSDINNFYKSSWVKEFISVEILASHKGVMKKAVSKSDVLSQEQKNLIDKVDLGTDILVNIEYIPDNTLKHNDPKIYDFTFTVDPETEASYVGSEQALQQYLKANVMDKVSKNIFTQYLVTAVKFTIDEEGHVTDAHVFDSSIYNDAEDKQTDDLLLAAICNMPNWEPAAYANGTKTKQEFVLTVGDHNSCILNLLNIRNNLAVRSE